MRTRRYAEIHVGDAGGAVRGSEDRHEEYAFPETPSSLKFSARKPIERPEECFDETSVVQATLGPTAVDMTYAGHRLRTNARAKKEKDTKEAEQAASQACQVRQASHQAQQAQKAQQAQQAKQAK